MMFDDISRKLSGLSLAEQIMGNSSKFQKSLAAYDFFNQPNWAKNANDPYLSLSALTGKTSAMMMAMERHSQQPSVFDVLTGNTSAMLAAMKSVPKVPKNALLGLTSGLASLAMPKMPDTALSAFMGIGSQWSHMMAKDSAYNTSIAALAGMSSWSKVIEDSYKFAYPSNNWAPMFSGATTIGQMLKTQPLGGWPKISQDFSIEKIKPKRKRRTKQEFALSPVTANVVNNMNITATRYVDNVGELISETSNFDSHEVEEIKANFDKALRQEIAISAGLPLTLYVYEYILENYSQILENIIQAGELSQELFKGLLKSTSPDSVNFSAVTWIFFTLLTGWATSYSYDKILKRDETATGEGNMPMNAVTTISKNVLVNPNSRSKLICIIPTFTTVQLGTIKGKYILISFIQEGCKKEGWTLNEGFEHK